MILHQLLNSGMILPESGEEAGMPLRIHDLLSDIETRDGSTIKMSDAGASARRWSC